MFLEYYGLQEQPFGVTPDPRFLFNSSTHREALASLLVGIMAKRGFLALVAPPGMGKTTLLFQVMKNLEPTARTVFLFQTQCDSRELIRYILTDMGIETSGQDVVKMHAQLNEALVANARGGKQFVLIIDEAQNLSPAALETVRLLSDFETTRSKLMQIILAGQPALAETLARPDLVQLSQRISILSRLTALSPMETAQYIKHRLQLAGHPDGGLFSSAALELIAGYSKGIPRTINNLCFNALSWGCATKSKVIDAKILREVSAELAVNIVSQAKPSSPTPFTQLVGVIAVPQFVQPARAATHSKWIPRAATTAALLLMGLLFVYVLQKNHSTVIAGVRPPAPTGSAAPAGNLLQAPTATALPTPVPLKVSKANGPAVSGSETDNEAIVVVEPNQALWRISRDNIGRSEPSIIKQILQLNPFIVNPDHIEVGQRIRLPRMRGGSEEVSVTHQNPNGTNAKGGSDLE